MSKDAPLTPQKLRAKFREHLLANVIIAG